MKKRLLCVILCVGMVAAAVCGCGKTAQNPQNGVESVESGEDRGNAKSRLARQGVYEVDSFDINGVPDEQGHETIIDEFCVGERFYMVVREQDDQSVKVISMNKDGSDQTVIEPVQEMAPQDLPEKVSRYISYAHYQVNTAGDLLAVKTDYYLDSRDQDQITGQTVVSVCCWDTQGRLQWEKPIEEPMIKEGKAYVGALCGLPDGTTAVMIGGKKIGKYIVNTEGDLSELQEMGDYGGAFLRFTQIQSYDFGKVQIRYTDEAKEREYVQKYDVAADVVGEGVEIPQYLMSNGLGNPVLNEQNELIYNTEDGIFSYEAAGGKNTQLMNFVNSDLAVSGMFALLPLDEGKFMAIYSGSGTGGAQYKGAVCQARNADRLPVQEVIELGGVYLGYELRERVVAYNRENTDRRIVVKDYSYLTGKEREDVGTGYTRLDAAIKDKEKTPDIIALNTYYMPADRYAAKGLLADIGAMMEADEEIRGGEYLTNVLDACKIDGKLYEVIPDFAISTYVGKASVFDGMNTWTLEDAAKLRETLTGGADKQTGGEGGDAAKEADKEADEKAVEENADRRMSMLGSRDFLKSTLRFRGKDMIDLVNKTCDLNSPEFIAYLEYASGMPEAAETLGEDDLREEKVLLTNCYLNSFNGLNYLWNGSFDGDMTFVGFPVYQGKGITAVQTELTYAIPAAAEDPEAAWSFLRYYLTDEYQSTVTDRLPISKKQLDEKLKAAAENTTDYVYWRNGEATILPALSKTQVDEVTKLIQSADRRTYIDSEINSIIEKETAGLFAGQRSAKDAASIIQNEVEEYLRKRK